VVLPLVLLIALMVTIGLLLGALRPPGGEPPRLLDGMFRYEADLGWPHGVQEQDGERAWVERVDPARTDQDDDRPAEPVPLVRVRRT
jgi:hypothetical protein